MSAAQLRLSLTEQETEMLDAVRGPATRTAYARCVLVEALQAGVAVKGGDAAWEKIREAATRGAQEA